MRDRNHPEYKYTEVDYEIDPLLRLERANRSTRQAIIYIIASPLITLFSGLVVAFFSRVQGGPLCDAGYATILCTRRAEILFTVVPMSVAFLGFLGCCLILYLKWRAYTRWTPWLAILWPLAFVCLGWMTAFGTLAILGPR
ncbi:MAG: hypothetical protein SPI77_02570 [Corynebacterium sp.]|nr:hypothetical protein [Corynebacterium sp.]